MPKAIETFHHALGTVECGADLPTDHPIVKAVPHLFAKAPGGPVAPVIAVVGDAGPEAVVLPATAKIVPAVKRKGKG